MPTSVVPRASDATDRVARAERLQQRRACSGDRCTERRCATSRRDDVATRRCRWTASVDGFGAGAAAGVPRRKARTKSGSAIVTVALRAMRARFARFAVSEAVVSVRNDSVTRGCSDSRSTLDQGRYTNRQSQSAFVVLICGGRTVEMWRRLEKRRFARSGGGRTEEGYLASQINLT